MGKPIIDATGETHVFEKVLKHPRYRRGAERGRTREEIEASLLDIAEKMAEEKPITRLPNGRWARVAFHAAGWGRLA